MKALSYNILEGGDNRLPSIAGIIHGQQPDAVALLEANSESSAEALARELGMHLVFGRANSAFHIAWLTKRPARRSDNHHLPILSKTLLEVEVGEPGLRLFFASPALVGQLQGCDIVEGGEAARASAHLPIRADFA